MTKYKTPTKAERKQHLFNRLMALGFTYQECVSLYKIEMCLHRWHEKECGDVNGYAIERGEECNLQLMDSPEGKTGIWVVDKREKYIWPLRDCKTTDINSPEAKRGLRREKDLNIPGQAYMTYDKGFNGQRGKYPIADRETGAIKRLDTIMLGKGHLWYYIQGDPRGCALYIGRNDDLKPDLVYWKNQDGKYQVGHNSLNPYGNMTWDDVLKAKAFIDYETKASSYTRGVAVCV